MRTYTVNDVAQMLDVDQETVRRWIRKGKLETEGEETSQGVPKKVTEESLVTFASSNKKYSEKLAGAIGTAASAATAVAGAAGIATSSAALAGAATTAAAAPFLGIGGAIFAGFNIAKAIDAAREQGVDLGDLASGIASTAEAYQREIEEKRSQIAKLEFEIGTAQEKIDRCGECLNKIYAAIMDEKNGSDESQEA
ncbi:helix-turn-helix domain-containing protein [Paratractidigestivibacter sp.]|uniref:helix-turn-helix domain-containing protein n=1 Tax=Paratractidigestivibacter sp. TaxID=2847316 RepID=UPI002AC9AA4C|nr:helix-turn-helix domain-containing protein [Paratractidigestivibacter sp.]